MTLSSPLICWEKSVLPDWISLPANHIASLSWLASDLVHKDALCNQLTELVLSDNAMICSSFWIAGSEIWISRSIDMIIYKN